MGSFILKPLDVDTDDGFEAILNSVSFPTPTEEELAEAASTDPGGPFSGYYISKQNSVNSVLDFSCLGLCLYLDGSPTPIDTNNLPVGFAVTDANVHALLFNITTGEISLTRNGSILATQTDAGDQDLTIPLGVITNLSLITSILGFIHTNPSSNLNHVTGSELSIVGTYTSDAFPFQITPPSGNVEPGQVVVVTGPGAENLTYAALQDDKVIPIVVKKAPDEVTIEIPKPPTDDCEVALAACPECEDCFDACSEDLNSEACQECLDACLDCLEEELEDLEEAEECQQSQEDDPPVNIVIICGDPTGTQFNGSVTLGSFTIIVANASGIYRLVDGKTNDTQYTTARDGETYDVKIPNPFGKTGFFRS